MSSTSDQPVTEDPPDWPDTPWAELDRSKRTELILGWVIGGGILLGVIGFVVVGTVVATLQVFEPRPPSHHCELVAQRHCLTAIPARVQFADTLSFTTSADRPPYSREISLPAGPTPAVGTRVTLEEWNDHVVSFIDPTGRRRHTSAWPDHGDDLGTAIVFNVSFWGMVAFVVAAWLEGRRNERHAAARAGLTEQPARTS